MSRPALLAVVLGLVVMATVCVAAPSSSVEGDQDINFVLSNLTALWEEVERLRHDLNDHRHGDPPHDLITEHVDVMKHERQVHHRQRPHEGHNDHHDPHLLQHLEHFHDDHHHRHSHDHSADTHDHDGHDHSHHHHHNETHDHPADTHAHGHHDHSHDHHGHDDHDHSHDRHSHDGHDHHHHDDHHHHHHDHGVSHDHSGDTHDHQGHDHSNDTHNHEGHDHSHDHNHSHDHDHSSNTHNHEGHDHSHDHDHSHNHSGDTHNHEGHDHSQDDHQHDHDYENHHGEDAHDRHGLHDTPKHNTISNAFRSTLPVFLGPVLAPKRGLALIPGREQAAADQGDEWAHASCVLKPNADLPDGTVSGEVIISQKKDGSGPVFFHIDAQGFKPSEGIVHGFHIHQSPVTDDRCATAGGHFNPYNATHGGPHSSVRHVGDLGNIEVDSEGKLEDFVLSDNDVAFSGDASIIGKSIVVHAGKDDLGLGGDAGSLATGNAGGRLACCNIYIRAEYTYRFKG